MFSDKGNLIKLKGSYNAKICEIVRMPAVDLFNFELHIYTNTKNKTFRFMETAVEFIRRPEAIQVHATSVNAEYYYFRKNIVCVSFMNVNPRLFSIFGIKDPKTTSIHGTVIQCSADITKYNRTDTGNPDCLDCVKITIYM